MNYGEWAIITLWTINLVSVIILHDTPKPATRYNFYVSFFSTVLSFALMYWAGLFRNI
jgi:hypothetical protein